MAINGIHLKQLLNLDLVDLKQLEKTLEIERKVLASNQAALIQKASQEKQRILTSIKARAKEKTRLIIQSGLPVKAGHITEAIDSVNDKELSLLWKAVSEKLERCKEQNLVNGKIVSISLQRTTKAMSIVRGQHNKPNLYGSKGSQQSLNTSSMIGKA